MKKSCLFAALLFCTAVALPAVKADEVPAVPAGQIAYYSFDNDVKECLKDSVSSLDIVPRKTLPSSDFKPGVSGKALELQANSKGQYVCRDPRLTKLAPPFTVSVWIKRYDRETKNSIIVATASDQSPKGFELVWSWRYLVFRMGKGAGKKPFVIKSAEPVLPVDSWINVAVSCDEKSAVLYINGEKIADGVLAQGEKFVPADGIGTLFTIGHYPTPLDAYKHIGLIDELRIFNRALTAEEIAGVMFLAQQ
ncbi:MAG: LamG domain-containing protein [Lentisphaerae bacterium]|nr:LamG domain-containing protein [Lentisphaerota bacterium]